MPISSPRAVLGILCDIPLFEFCEQLPPTALMLISKTASITSPRFNGCHNGVRAGLPGHKGAARIGLERFNNGFGTLSLLNIQPGNQVSFGFPFIF